MRQAKTWTAVSTFIRSHLQGLGNHTNEWTPVGLEPSTSCKSSQRLTTWATGTRSLVTLQNSTKDSCAGFYCLLGAITWRIVTLFVVHHWQVQPASQVKICKRITPITWFSASDQTMDRYGGLTRTAWKLRKMPIEQNFIARGYFRTNVFTAKAWTAKLMTSDNEGSFAVSWELSTPFTKKL